MKLRNNPFVYLYVLPLLLVIQCQNKWSVSNLEISSIDLLRGDIVLCGGDQFGEVSFPLSCHAKSRRPFNLAISLLHSFEYDEAEKAFVQVIDADPDCAMAYWGVAMCNFHALWRPPTEKDLKKGSKALEIARLIPNKTEKETAYIEAITAFYSEWETVGHVTRTVRFEKGMEAIYKKYPNDKESSIFYALALNSAADLADKSYQNRRKAASILEGLFPDQPNHPGIAHYIIHSYDYPELAELALGAARRYASIAPSSAHAQHMPSHIFTRLGLWEESIKSNLDATASAKCYAEQVSMNGNWDEEIHGVDYLVYAYLQTGKIKKAEDLLNYLRSIKHINPIGVKGAYPSAAIPARFYLETRQWNMAANLRMPSSDYPLERFPWSNGIIHFARILGAVHTGQMDSAKKDFEYLVTCHEILLKDENLYMANQVLIMVKSADAWIHYLAGDHEQAQSLMTAAAEMESKTEKQSLTPGEVLSAQELLGDLLLKIEKPDDALKAYEFNLKIRPNRYNGLYGAAVASKKMGDNKKASHYFKLLLNLTQTSEVTRPEMKEARLFLNSQNSI